MLRNVWETDPCLPITCLEIEREREREPRMVFTRREMRKRIREHVMKMWWFPYAIPKGTAT